MLLFMYRTLVLPAMRTVRERTAAPGAGLYVPLIVLVRSLCNNYGQFVGLRELRKRTPFQDNLDRYVTGNWTMAPDA